MKTTMAAFLAVTMLTCPGFDAQGADSTTDEPKVSSSASGTFSIDGASLAAALSDAQDNADDNQLKIAEAFAKVTSCLVVEPVAGANGKTLQISPVSGEAELTVKARVDEAKYQAFATELLNAISPIAKFDKKAFAKMSPKSNSGSNKNNACNHSKEFWENGGLTIPMPISNRDVEKESRDRMEDESGRILYVVEKAKSGKTRILQFDKDTAETIKQEMDIGDLAFRVRLLDKDGDDAIEPVIQSVNEEENGKERDPNTAAIFVDMVGAGFSGHPNTGVLALGLILPRLGGAFSIQYGWDDGNKLGFYEIAPSQPWFYPVVTQKTFTISLGTLDASDLSSVSSLKIDVGRMKDGEFLED